MGRGALARAGRLSRRVAFVLAVAVLVASSAVGAAVVGAAPAAVGAAPAPGGGLAHFVHDSWTQDQGLPQNTVFAMARTTDGYLWVSTFEGLARFDGVRFVPQPLVTGDGARWAAEPEALLADRAGALWIGTSLGVLRLRHGRITAYRFATEVQPRVRFTNLRLTEDADGSIWVATGTSAPQRVDGSGLSEPRLPGSAELAGATAMTRAPDGAKLVAAPSGLWRLTDAGASRLPVPKGCEGPVDHLAWGPTGLVLALRAGGLCLGAGPAELAPLPTPFGAVPFNAPVDDGGALWLPSTAGLARYAGGAFDTWRVGEHVRGVLLDREGSVWVGTAVNGLHRLRPSIVTTYAPPGGESPVYTLGPAPDGSMFFGTERAGICRVQGDHVSTALPRDPNEFARQGLAVLPGGVLATAILDELVLHPPGGADQRHTLGLASTGLRTSLFLDSGGVLWAASNAPGKIARLESGTVTTLEPPTPTSVLTMAEHPPGTIWFGGSEGLLTWSGGAFRAAPAPSGERVTRLVFDERGVGWITTDHGLWRMQEGRLRHLGVEEGLPSEGLHGVLDDGRGRLWLHGNTGLISVSRVELDQVASGRRKRAEVTWYDRLDGLPSREFNGGPTTSAKDARGRLWFANLRGAVLVEPDRVAQGAPPPPVVIESLAVDGRPVALTDPAEGRRSAVVPPGGTQYAIEYTGLSLLLPSRVRFRYRLEGYEEAWVDAGTRRTAFYTALPPGRHRFTVMAASQDGRWSEVGATLSLEVKPFFYQTRAFLALAALAGLLLVGAVAWGGARLRIRQLQEQRRRLEAIVEERTRDLALAKERGDRLLRNILPETIALRLQHSSEAIADHYPEATVLFADIVGFTDLSARVSPGELVAMLNDLFSRFDGLLERDQIEKIKTIGDAYMAVAGVPAPISDHAGAMVDLGFGMIREMEAFNAARGLELRMRIGINTGAVVAGVIGKRKFIYDLWGDTVNTASRMESHGVPGRIHVTASTWERIASRFECEERGLIQVKGKGELRTYLVIRPRPAAAEDPVVGAGASG